LRNIGSVREIGPAAAVQEAVAMAAGVGSMRLP
jgi:hypothetical protein